jgi:hypothetical protein
VAILAEGPGKVKLAKSTEIRAISKKCEVGYASPAGMRVKTFSFSDPEAAALAAAARRERHTQPHDYLSNDHNFNDMSVNMLPE